MLHGAGHLERNQALRAPRVDVVHRVRRPQRVAARAFDATRLRTADVRAPGKRIIFARGTGCLAMQLQTVEFCLILN